MRLPPLNALRAFEAAARHQSFSRAAAELNVTQGAVSRHVKLLEEHLGVALFRRLPRGLELTEPGRGLLPTVSDSFRRIAEAARRSAAATRDLDVICAPSFAIRWLIPQLAGFQARHPELRVRLNTDCTYFGDFYKGEFDLAIDTHDSLQNNDYEILPIRKEYLTPVCAPTLAEPTNLADQILLHDCLDWQRWLAAAGISGIDPQDGQTFPNMDMSVRAAIAGQGIAIGDLSLFKEELERGQLVAPFDFVLSEDTGYYLIAAPGRMAEPKIAAFRDWLFEEIGEDL
ncbi:MAG: transcriptional regulator GcvA [Pseudomonadota bacterium]